MKLAAVAVIALALSGCVSARMQQVGEEVDAEKAICRAQNFTKKVQLSQCLNNAEQRFAGVYPYPDLLQLRAATRLALSERQDRGEITQAQAELEFAQVITQITAQEQSRATNAQMADAATRMSMPRRTTCNRYGNTVTCF